MKYDVLLPQAKDDSPDYMEVKDKNGHAIMKHVFAAQVSWWRNRLNVLLSNYQVWAT